MPQRGEQGGFAPRPQTPWGVITPNASGSGGLIKQTSSNFAKLISRP